MIDELAATTHSFAQQRFDDSSLALHPQILTL